jgi:hypothetical protein
VTDSRAKRINRLLRDRAAARDASRPTGGRLAAYLARHHHDICALDPCPDHDDPTSPDEDRPQCSST